MSNKRSHDLISKYLDAETTLDEEQELFRAKGQVRQIEDWFAFINKKRKHSPPHLSQSIRAAIRHRKVSKQRVLLRLSGLAASIILLLGFCIYNAHLKSSDYREKKALLREALSMFPSDQQVHEPPGVLYEDEMIVIYIDSK